jgi:hypothetical protein
LSAALPSVGFSGKLAVGDSFEAVTIVPGQQPSLTSSEQSEIN